MRWAAAPSTRSPRKRISPACGAHEPHQRAHGGGLAHAVAPHQRHDLAVADAEGDAEQHLAQPVGSSRDRATSSSMRQSFCVPEIGGADSRIGADLVRRAGRDGAAGDEHADAVGEREHGVHVVLDQHDRVVRASDRREAASCVAPSCRPMPAIGSSSRSRLGRMASAIASSSCRRSPCERFSAIRLGAIRQADGGDRLPGRLEQRRIARRPRRRTGSCGPACAWTASATLASAENFGKIDVIWNERAMPSAARR